MPELKFPPDADVGSAMQRAVVAERDARQAIADAQAAATVAVEQARGQARAILDGVPARIERLRARGARAVQRELARIQTEEENALRSLGDHAFPADLLEATTAALVARLAGEPERKA